MSEQKVMFGLENLYYAPYIPGAGGARGEWAKPIRIPGAVSFSPSPQGNEYTFHADNIPYFHYTKDNGDAGDLVVAHFPDQFLIDTLGWAKSVEGAIVELANKVQKPFALLFEVKGVNSADEEDPVRFVYYHVNGAKPAQTYTTMEDGASVQTQTMAIKATPYAFDNNNAATRVKVRKSLMPAVFESFFDAVFVPNLKQSVESASATLLAAPASAEASSKK